MTNDGMIIFSYQSGKSILSVRGKTVDEVVLKILELKSAEIALAFYQSENQVCDEANRNILEGIVTNNGSFREIYDFFKVNPTRAKELEDAMITAFFSENVICPHKFDYVEPSDYEPFPPIIPYGKSNEACFIDYYKSSNGLVDPNNAIDHCIRLKLTNQANALIALAELDGANRFKVRDYLFETKDLLGLINYYAKFESDEDGTEHIGSKLICETALDILNDIKDDKLRGKVLYNAILAVNAPEFLEKLCGTFASTCKNALYASYIAGEVYKKYQKLEEDESSKLILKSFIRTLEEIVLKNCRWDCEPLYVFIKYVGCANKRLLYWKMLDISGNIVHDVYFYNSELAREAKRYISKASSFVSPKDRILARLGVVEMPV